MSSTAEAVRRTGVARLGPVVRARGRPSRGLACPLAATALHVATLVALAAEAPGLRPTRLLAILVLLAGATLVPLRPGARAVAVVGRRSVAVRDGVVVLARTAMAWLVAAWMLPGVAPGWLVAGNLAILAGLLAFEAGQRRRGALIVLPVAAGTPTHGLARLAKRAIDVVITLTAGVMLLPFVVVAAVAIRLEDGGPILYRQVRVGRDGRPFTLLKLRSMVPDADRRLADLEDANLRTGPLFKAARDPRVTRVGQLLRATSLDEVPQLVNVLRGEMSLVGPRPALPREVEAFDAGLRRREQVLPGLTGLWQVEDRDSGCFDAYRHHDLFYVDNWSLALDLSILASTVTVVLGRALSVASGRTPGD